MSDHARGEFVSIIGPDVAGPGPFTLSVTVKNVGFAGLVPISVTGPTVGINIYDEFMEANEEKTFDFIMLMGPTEFDIIIATGYFLGDSRIRDRFTHKVVEPAYEVVNPVAVIRSYDVPEIVSPGAFDVNIEVYNAGITGDVFVEIQVGDGESDIQVYNLIQTQTVGHGWTVILDEFQEVVTLRVGHFIDSSRIYDKEMSFLVQSDEQISNNNSFLIAGLLGIGLLGILAIKK